MPQADAAVQATASSPKLIVFLPVTLLAVAVWAALRAYTGIFGILNFRVFVGAFILAIPMVAAGAFQGKSVSWRLVQSLLGLATVVGGEGIGSYLSGTAPVIDKFTLIYLGIAVALPWLNPK